MRDPAGRKNPGTMLCDGQPIDFALDDQSVTRGWIQNRPKPWFALPFPTSTGSRGYAPRDPVPTRGATVTGHATQRLRLWAAMMLLEWLHATAFAQ